MFELTCMHGHGVWHWVMDIGLAIPFLATTWWWLKGKLGCPGCKGKGEHHVEVSFVHTDKKSTTKEPEAR